MKIVDRFEKSFQVVPTGPSFFVLDLHLIEGYSDNDGIGDELCVVPKLCGVLNLLALNPWPRQKSDCPPLLLLQLQWRVLVPHTHHRGKHSWKRVSSWQLWELPRHKTRSSRPFMSPSVNLILLLYFDKIWTSNIDPPIHLLLLSYVNCTKIMKPPYIYPPLMPPQLTSCCFLC